jgi:pre-mRNA 3'-end-processing factor FIP1
MFDGRSILEVDLGAMSDKPWRRAGSDISDWFNYGFDEISWEAYCYRRRELGDMASVLKANVIVGFFFPYLCSIEPLADVHSLSQNFAGMGEDQITALPPELRQMVMTGTSAMMNNSMQGNPMNVPGPSPAMMNPQMMMEMQGMMMNMGVQDMAAAAQMMQQLQQQGQDGSGGGGPGGGGQGGGPGGPQDGSAGMMMQDGYPGGPSGMMNMGGMGADYGMQVRCTY